MPTLYKTISTFIYLLSVLCIFSTTSNAQKPRFKEKKIAKSLQGHTLQLASSEMEGRRVGTAGERKAVEYIEKEFIKLGLEPKGKNGYYQYISIPSLRMAQSNTKLKMGDDTLALFGNFYPISTSSNYGRYTGKAIHVDHGIIDAGLKTDNYAGKNVKDKAVIINLDLPGGSNSHNRFSNWDNVEMRVSLAKTMGVKAIILYSTDSINIPSGVLNKNQENTHTPIFFVKKDLSAIDSVNIELNVDIMLLSKNAHNVIGYIDNHSKNTVLISAHHDHIGFGENGGSYAGNSKQWHPGADDASGVAALLVLAKLIKAKPKRFGNQNYLFVSFSGHENSLLGSKQFIQKQATLLDQINYAINLDRIGHLDSITKTLYVNGAIFTAELDNAIQNTKVTKRKIAKIESTKTQLGKSDDTYIAVSHKPTMSFSTGYYQGYRTPMDKASTLNYGGEAFIVCYLYKIIRELEGSERMEYGITNESVQLEPIEIKFIKKNLYLELDQKYSGQGVKVIAVEAKKIAANAGILPNDIILEINGNKTSNVAEYNAAKGQLTTDGLSIIKIKRGDNIKMLNTEIH